MIPKRKKVLLPVELENSGYVGDLLGYYHPETGIYNILAWDDVSRKLYANQGLQVIGRIQNESFEEREQPKDDLLLGVWRGKELVFKVGGDLCQKEHYNLIQDVFSRNTGILETDWLMDKTAFIIGCGSVGSFVAVELAKAGVGRFVLVDNDVMAYHNICRHQCGIYDVGKYKVNAVKERILEINPIATVSTYVGIIERLDKTVFDEHCTSNAIIVSCADNREADLYASKIANIYNVPFVSIGFWERAFAGEVFYFIPSENMPCYECAIGGGSFASTSRVSSNRRFYTTQENLENVNFEPGIAADIDFVTLVAVKLILDILNRDNPKFTPRVINHLAQFTLVCNTNDPRIGGEMAEIFAYPLQITRSINLKFKNPCPPCKYRS